MFPQAWRRLWKGMEVAAKPRSSRCKLSLETLEDRLVPAVITTPSTIFVGGTGDGGFGTVVKSGPASYTVPTLRQAIALAQGEISTAEGNYLHGNDTIQLKTLVYTLGEDGELYIPFDEDASGSQTNHDVGSLTIQNYQGGMSVIDAQRRDRVFEVDGDPFKTPTHKTGVTFNFLRIQNGFVGGEGAADYGGGILNHGDLTLNSCEVTKNEVNLSDSSFDNIAEGGGIFNGASYDPGNGSVGGSLQPTLNLNNSQISYNKVTGRSFDAYGGMAAGFASVHPFQLSGGQDGANGGDAKGGGLFIEGSSGAVSISRTTFFANSANGGTAASGDMSDVECTVDVTGGGGFGGGIYVESHGTISPNSGLKVVNSTFAENVVYGGNVNLGDNPAPNFGGDADGGGIYLESDFRARTFINDTIAHNHAFSGYGSSDTGVSDGAGVFTEDSPPDSLAVRPFEIAGVLASFQNTIIALNTQTADQSASGSDVSGAVQSNGNNLIGDHRGSFGFYAAMHDQQGGFGLSSNPGLLDPRFTSTTPVGGGPVRNGPGPGNPYRFQLLVYNLSANSPARDKGKNTPEAGGTDQIGNPRVVNGIIDIGAIEFFAGLGKWGSRYYNP